MKDRSEVEEVLREALGAAEDSGYEDERADAVADALQWVLGSGDRPEFDHD